MNHSLIKILLLSLLLLSCSNFATSETDATNVLVFGGTGRLGSDVVKALVNEGHEVTVFARTTSNRDRLEGLNIHYVIGDVLIAASVEQAMSAAEHDVVIDALGRGSSDVDFYRTSAENIAQSAARNNVKQIILHGSIGAGNSSSFAGGMQKLFDAKTAGENAVMNSGVNYSIIRNGHLMRYGTMDNGNAKLYEDTSISGSVSRAALARLTTECILSTACENKIFHAINKSH